MADFVSPEKRSRIMRGSKSKNTKPELVVRRALQNVRRGYRLHRRDIPGRPDIAFIGLQKAIFVHGCFWHQHEKSGCPVSRKPSSNSGFWEAKFLNNKERDRRNRNALIQQGWGVLEIWECEVHSDDLEDRLSDFLR
ncbi:very short patch repair endonuclease [Qipengyuania sp. 1NDH17]|uniref:Very short patch repair endonuclease n=2 Tax=Qipengyuania polymorpha TaxID=2867234 RepID=A0ABS7IWK4_9SPHN|nr:very short patch repair endonuclease [Qipengyuania polymorpha]MBX7456762.1 very short patch repair endonuclease [Qipengyuania polymorpha]